MKDDMFARISNKLMYTQNNDLENATLKRISDDGYKDNYLMIVIYNIYTMSDFEMKYQSTLDNLIIKSIGKVANANRDRKNFINTLNILERYGLIKINILSTTGALDIDVDNLLEIEDNIGYFIMTKSEIDLFKSLGSNVKERNGLMKVFYLLKARTNKNTMNTLTCNPSLDIIAKDTCIPKSTIERYIEVLKENGLIKYIKLGTKSKKIKDKVVISYCVNIYSICSICLELKKDIDIELKEAKEGQINYYISQGYQINS